VLVHVFDRGEEIEQPHAADLLERPAAVEARQDRVGGQPFLLAG
jgi:hypothetical protein